MSRGKKIAMMAVEKDKTIYDFQEDSEDPWKHFHEWKRENMQIAFPGTSETQKAGPPDRISKIFNDCNLEESEILKPSDQTTYIDDTDNSLESSETDVINPKNSKKYKRIRLLSETSISNSTETVVSDAVEKGLNQSLNQNAILENRATNLKESDISKKPHQIIDLIESDHNHKSLATFDKETIITKMRKKFTRIECQSETSINNLTAEGVSESIEKGINPSLKTKDSSKNINDELLKNVKTVNQSTEFKMTQEKNKNNRFLIPQRVPRDIVNSDHKVEVSRRMQCVWDKKDRCPFCNEDITNFSRHLFRNHSKEEEVRKILSISKRDKKRKNLINLLRKQGNYSAFSENVIRPVQRPSGYRIEIDSTFLPCKYCKGLYRKQSLNRHVKACAFNCDNTSGVRYGSEGQTMLAFAASRERFLSRLRLRNEVFPKMKVDKISLFGKSDPIVCQYAEDYLRKHKRPHIVSLVSNKIRELGRLLICLKDVYNINSLLEALKPENFNNVVHAAKIISGYDDSSKTFAAPSLALHFRTILHTICSTAITLLIKKDPILAVTNHEEILIYVKKFQKLVEVNWKFEMGSLALKDITEKNSTRKLNLPIAKDILLFNTYCHTVAEEAANRLKISIQDIDAFKKLSETVLVLTISLNRKRVGDVQYIKRKCYMSSNENPEECINTVTEAEKGLAKHFKRITTIGKGSKSIPLLFPKKIQEYIELMLKFRDITDFVPEENPYLFPLVGSKTQWLNGFNALKKYAKLCGAVYPNTLTSSRLRKQIATVLQILSLNEVEMEQVATFMGHTRKTHEAFYRMPQEVFQTSKIAKLLLAMMGKGINTEDQGKTINDLDIELNALETRNTTDTNKSQEKIVGKDLDLDRFDNELDSELNDTNNTNKNEEKMAEENFKENLESDLVSENDIINTSNRLNSSCEKQKKESSDLSFTAAPKQKLTAMNTRGSWTSKQKKIMLKYFKNEIDNRIAPKKNECLQFKNKFLEIFANKTWIQIKTFVYNTYRIKDQNQ